MSRASKFETCPRAYWYHYYGAWGGWKRGAPAAVREAYLLKKLSPRAAWAGSAVHDLLAALLATHKRRGGGLPPLEEAVERLHAVMADEFRGSRAGRYRHQKALGLLEHEYDEAVSDDQWRETYAKARASLEGFYQSPVFEEILASDPAGWFPIDALASFPFEGTQIYAAPDFAFRVEGDRVRMLDWKTGRPREKDLDQLKGYVLFVESQWGISRHALQAELHYLGQGETTLVEIDDASLEAFTDRMRASIAEMQARLDDVEGNVASPERFEPTPSARTCARCNFRRLCEARLDAAPPSPAPEAL